MTTGEGGMITTNDEQIYNKARLLREHGMPERYRHAMLGYNFRMTDIHAAIGLVQLQKLEKYIQQRRSNADFYNKNLNIPGIILPRTLENTRHVYHQFTLRITNQFKLKREELMKKLTEAGIGNVIYYPTPVYEQEPYKSQNYPADCKTAEKICKEVLSIPIHPNIQPIDLETIKNVFKLI